MTTQTVDPPQTQTPQGRAGGGLLDPAMLLASVPDQGPGKVGSPSV